MRSAAAIACRAIARRSFDSLSPLEARSAWTSWRTRSRSSSRSLLNSLARQFHAVGSFTGGQQILRSPLPRSTGHRKLHPIHLGPGWRVLVARVRPPRGIAQVEALPSGRPRCRARVASRSSKVTPVIASIGCSFSGLGFVAKPLSQKQGAPSCRFRALTLRWIRAKERRVRSAAAIACRAIARRSFIRCHPSRRGALGRAGGLGLGPPRAACSTPLQPVSRGRQLH